MKRSRLFLLTMAGVGCWRGDGPEAAGAGRRRAASRRPAPHRQPGGLVKSLSKYLKPTGRLVIVDYLAKQGPHRDDPSLQVGKEEAAKLLAAIGFKPVDDVALFPDKYFVIYRR